MTVFDVQEKRKEWKKTIQPDMVEHLVFLDESGVNTNLTRLYGRALSSQRAVDHAPLNTPQTTTILSSIRLNGEKAFTTYQGGTTGERFVQYLKETLLPTLRACLISRRVWIGEWIFCPARQKSAGILTDGKDF